MLSFNIPEKHISKFIGFVKSSEEFKSNFASALNSFEGELNFDLLLEHLENAIGTQNKTLIRNTLEIYNNLINAKNSMDIPLNEFLDILKEALIETKNEKLKPNEYIIQTFSSILSTKNNFNIKMRLGSLSTEYHNIFISANVFQDVRTIFDESNDILGSIITHNLKIVSKQNKEIKESYISFSESELQELADIIESAKLQAKVLKEKLPNSKIINL